MTIHLTCKHCGVALKVKDKKAGTHAACPQCHEDVLIPDAPHETVADEHALADHASEEDVSAKAAPRNAASELPAEAELPVGILSDSAADETDSGELGLGQLDEEVRLVERKEPASTKSGKSRVKRKPTDFDPADFLMETSATDEAPHHRTDDRPRFDPIEMEPLADHSHESESDHRRSKTPMPTTRGTPLASSSEAAQSHAAVAKKLMKAIKQVNAESHEKHEAEKHPQFDYAGAFREFGVKGLGGVVLVLIAATGLYYLANSIMGGGPRLPPLGYVTGTVTLNGQPLEGAFVYFAPADPKFPGHEHERIRTSTGVTDSQGKYTMYYLDQVAGTAVGKCRVWLSRMGDHGQESIPDQYQEVAMQMRDVSKGTQSIDFTLSTDSKTAKR